MTTKAIPAKKETNGVILSKAYETIKRRVILQGLTPIMFDRYPGDNDSKLEPWQKLYLSPQRGIGIPQENIVSFLSGHNTNSAPKRLRDKRRYKDIANAMLSFVTIDPSFLPLLRNGQPIVFGKLENDVDELSGVYLHRSVARLDKGIPNPKVRPVVPLPWSIELVLSMLPNREIKEQEVMNLIEEGGRAVGLGTYRGVFGKFFIEAWTKI